MGKVKLNKKQSEILIRMKTNGDFIFENTVTPGARWCIGKTWGNWGNVHGSVVSGIKPFLLSEIVNTGVYRYSLNTAGIELPISELGKSIEL
jgi:hypothetical protein